MKNSWLIAVIVILLIVGSIGSAYMLRSVGSLSIDLETLKQTALTQQTTIATLQEQVDGLQEAAQTAQETIQSLQADNADFRDKVDYIGQLLVDIPGVVTRFGTIEDLQAANGYVTFRIDLKEWLSGEAALTFLMDEYGLTIEQAVDQLPNNFYIRDLEDEAIFYRLDKSAFINLFAEDTLEPADLNTLITLVTDSADFENYPLFEFYVIDDLVLEVDEQYLP